MVRWPAIFDDQQRTARSWVYEFGSTLSWARLCFSLYTQTLTCPRIPPTAWKQLCVTVAVPTWLWMRTLPSFSGTGETLWQTCVVWRDRAFVAWLKLPFKQVILTACTFEQCFSPVDPASTHTRTRSRTSTVLSLIGQSGNYSQFFLHVFFFLFSPFFLFSCFLFFDFFCLSLCPLSFLVRLSFCPFYPFFLFLFLFCLFPFSFLFWNSYMLSTMTRPCTLYKLALLPSVHSPDQVWYLFLSSLIAHTPWTAQEGDPRHIVTRSHNSSSHNISSWLRSAGGVVWRSWWESAPEERRAPSDLFWEWHSGEYPLKIWWWSRAWIGPEFRGNTSSPCWGAHRGDRWSRNKEGCAWMRNKKRLVENIQNVLVRLFQCKTQSTHTNVLHRLNLRVLHRWVTQTSFREESMDSTSKMLGSIVMSVSLSFEVKDYDISRAYLQGTKEKLIYIWPKRVLNTTPNFERRMWHRVEANTMQHCSIIQTKIWEWQCMVTWSVCWTMMDSNTSTFQKSMERHGRTPGF